MARLLLVPLAVLALLGGLVMFAAAIVSLTGGVMHGAADPVVRAELHATVWGALGVAAIAVPLGFTGALSVWRTPVMLRGAVLGAAVLMLLCPMPPFPGLHLVPMHFVDALATGATIGRGVALSLLCFAFVLRTAPAGLRRSAESAGATPLRAWWDVMVRPLWRVGLVAFVIAFLNALALGPAAMQIGRHLDIPDVWLAPASLMMLAAGAAALDVLFRKPGRAA